MRPNRHVARKAARRDARALKGSENASPAKRKALRRQRKALRKLMRADRTFTLDDVEGERERTERGITYTLWALED